MVNCIFCKGSILGKVSKSTYETPGHGRSNNSCHKICNDKNEKRIKTQLGNNDQDGFKEMNKIFRGLK